MNLPIQTEKCTFAGSQQTLLDARLDTPRDISPRGYVVMSHCFTCTKETITTARVARGLAQAGWGVLRFDFTGLGASEGDFAASNFSSMVQDILLAANFLQQHVAAPCALLGHSMGGTASLVASVELDCVKTVVTLAAPALPKQVLHHFGSVLAQLEAGHDAQISVAGVLYPVQPQFIHDVRRFDFLSSMKHYRKPLLSVAAEKDELLKISVADDIAAYTQGTARVLVMPHADHLFSDRDVSNNMISQIAGWLNEFA